jgi:hypothetical protein
MLRAKAIQFQRGEVKGSSKVGSADTTLDRLRHEAEKSGDYSKVMAYRQKMRQNKK